ncbi:DUF4199 domain-containing protein [Tenacibaculum sp. SDUM215027]|uniref:DUF4199 domain-containing protein n=1 Tax=Tenacibaculum sp. SDUM215027 TaxID=3422596 RepID=UPI003D31A4E3
MENQANSKNIILNYGLYLGGASILIALIKYALGMQYIQEFISGIAGFIALVAFIILGIRKYKSNNNELISFGKALKVGLGITLIATLVIITYYAIFAFVIEPNFMNNTIEMQKVIWADSFGMTPEQIEESENQSRKFFFLSLFGGVFIMNMFLGGVTSLIAGAVMKKTEEEQY